MAIHGNAWSDALRVRIVHKAIILISLCGLVSCAAHRTVYQHRAARDDLVSLQEDQIQDNLVRIKSGRNALHVNYETITGKSSDKITGGAKWGDDDMDLAGEGSVIVAEPDQGSLPRFETNGEFTSSLDIAAKPVIGNATIYDAYEAFAKLYMKETRDRAVATKKTLWFRKADDADVWYYVRKTKTAKAAYRRIVSLTTLDQGKNRKIARVQIRLVSDAKVNGDGPGRYKVELYPKIKLQTGTLFLPARLSDVTTVRPVKCGETMRLYREKDHDSDGDSAVTIETIESQVTTEESRTTDTKPPAKPATNLQTRTTTTTKTKPKKPSTPTAIYAIETAEWDQKLKESIKHLNTRKQWLLLEYTPVSSGSSSSTSKSGGKSASGGSGKS